MGRCREQTFVRPTNGSGPGTTQNLALICQAVSEKMFDIVAISVVTINQQKNYVFVSRAIIGRYELKFSTIDLLKFNHGKVNIIGHRYKMSTNMLE